MTDAQVDEMVKRYRAAARKYATQGDQVAADALSELADRAEAIRAAQLSTRPTARAGSVPARSAVSQ